MRGPIACLFLAAALWAQQAPIPAEVKTRLGALLPKGGNAVRFYSSDLYRYMDGGADIYLKYGLVALAHREYKRAGVDMTVDVFDMGGPLQAFGIYSAERSPEYRFIDIGTEGYSSESTLNFLQGRYYVRLSAFGDGAAPALPHGDLDDRGEGRKVVACVLCHIPGRALRVQQTGRELARRDLVGTALEPAFGGQGRRLAGHSGP